MTEDESTRQSTKVVRITREVYEDAMKLKSEVGPTFKAMNEGSFLSFLVLKGVEAMQEGGR